MSAEMLNMDVKISDVVRSTAGHDKGNLFFVMSAESGFVTLCDGKARCIEQPKLKKFKHVQLVVAAQGTTPDKIKNGTLVTNKELRKALAEYSREVEEE